MWTRKFWQDTVERVIRTAAAVAAASISTTALIQDVDWAVVGGVTGLASLGTLLLALAAGTKANPDNASFRDDA